MILNRNYRKPVEAPKTTKKKDISAEVEKYFEARDFCGAIAIFEFLKQQGKQYKSIDPNLWIAYCNFHLGKYKESLTIYETALQQKEDEWRKEKEDNLNTSSNSLNLSLNGKTEDKKPAIPNQKKDGKQERVSDKDFLEKQEVKELNLWIACCQFFLGMYEEAEKSGDKGLPDDPLQVRLLFHIADKAHDEKRVVFYHKKLSNTIEDQLSLAAMHDLRNHVDEALKIYKKMLVADSSAVAFNFYMALCYFKLDVYEVALEVLNVFLSKYPDSPMAINLKACIQFKLYDAQVAEKELQPILDIQQTSYSLENPIIAHNLVIFREGKNALSVLPKLIDVIPEARLNLVIYYLLHDQIEEAFELIKDLKPVKAQEYILVAVVFALIGQKKDSKEYLKKSQQYFQLVGASPSETDTIPGRQCMASCYFLLKHFDDVLIYLKSIESFFEKDETFNWNYGIARAAAGYYKEAEESMSKISANSGNSPNDITIDFHYVLWMARIYIMNEKPGNAWELYLKMDSKKDAVKLLILIANECYLVGQFLYAAKAFDVLERLDPNSPEYWEGKRGAIVGLFQQVMAGKVTNKNLLKEAVDLLKNSENSQADQIERIISNWLDRQ